MDVMQLRRNLLMQKTQPSVINLCPAATGTEIMNNWQYVNGAFYYDLTGLDPNSDYTLQVTITAKWESTTGRRLYFYADSASGNFVGTSVDTVPTTRTMTRRPTAEGTLRITHNRPALINAPDYAASLTNIMVEIGSEPHPFVPYVGT